MPPGRGVRHAGFPGKPPVPAALQYKANAIPAPATSNVRGVSAGGMYAAPTHGPNANATKKGSGKAAAHGGAKTPPYRAKIYAMPTVPGRPPRSTTPQT